MHSTVEFSGGAIIGSIRISFPSATLIVDHKMITLRVFLLETYKFPNKLVTSIEKLGYARIAIHHVIPDYPVKIIFILDDASNIIQAIQETGFSPSCPIRGDIHVLRGGLPIHWQIIPIIFLWWNCLLLLGIRYPEMIVPFPVIALLGILSGCILILKSSKVQEVVLKPGRSIGEIKSLVILIALLDIFFLIVMLLTAFAQFFMS